MLAVYVVTVQNSGGYRCEALAPWQSPYRNSNVCPEGLPGANEIAALRSQWHLPATPHGYAALSWGLLHPAGAADQGDDLLAQVDDPAGLELGALELALGLELHGYADAQGAAEGVGDLLP